MEPGAWGTVLTVSGSSRSAALKNDDEDGGAGAAGVVLQGGGVCRCERLSPVGVPQTGQTAGRPQSSVVQLLHFISAPRACAVGAFAPPLPASRWHYTSTFSRIRYWLSSQYTIAVKYPVAQAQGFYRAVALWATCLSSEQNVDGSVMIPIKLQPTVGTRVPAHVDVLGHELPACGIAALLAGVIRRHKQHTPSGTCSLGDAELLELAPSQRLRLIDSSQL
jgi:hypothetical protein